MQLIENEKYDSDQPGIRYLPASFTLRTSLRSLIAYLLFTSAHRSCFRTWLPVKLVSVTKVVNQNIQGYRFNPSHFTAYKKIFCLSYPSFLLIYIYIYIYLRLFTFTAYGSRIKFIRYPILPKTNTIYDIDIYFWNFSRSSISIIRRRNIYI